MKTSPPPMKLKYLASSLVSRKTPLRTLLIMYVIVNIFLSYADGSQSHPPWHLDRLDQYKGLDSAPFRNAVTSRTRPVLYVIDSGVNAKHQEFSGRTSVVSGYNFVDDSWDSEDCLGHGTHIAALAAGSKYGVAGSIGVDIISVRILDCFGRGMCSAMIRALEWYVANRQLTSSQRYSLADHNLSTIRLTTEGSTTTILLYDLIFRASSS